jgi:hypothetical protein
MGLCGAALLLHPALAAAKESKRTVCTAAYASYKSALEREKAGHLREARDLYQTCAEATSCGGLVPKCKAALDKVSTQMPTIVPLVTDESGTPRVDVQVRMDGEPLTSRVDGRAFPVEVGMHELSFSTESGVIATQKVVVAEGEHNRQVLIKMTSPSDKSTQARPATTPPPAKEAPAERAAEVPHGEDTAEASSREERSSGGAWTLPHSALPYVIAVAGLAGVGGGVLLTVWGNKDNDLAVAQCNRSCPQSTVDHIRGRYIAADVSFGVGLAALGVATWMFASSRSVDEKPRPASALRLDVQPTRSGAFATLGGAF